MEQVSAQGCLSKRPARWGAYTGSSPTKVGKRGTIIVPAKLRKRYGIEEGMLVTTEAREDGVLIRPAVVMPVEKYTPERRAEFLLSTAATDKARMTKR